MAQFLVVRPLASMSILPVIKAPLAVQLYRVAFAACAYYFGSFVWQERRVGSLVGLLELQAFTFFSLLGLIYTCVRARRSRWPSARHTALGTRSRQARAQPTRTPAAATGRALQRARRLAFCCRAGW